MKQFSTGFQRVLALFLPAGLMMAFSVAVFIINCCAQHSPSALFIAIAYDLLFVFCDFHIKNLWLRCHCEIATAQAVQQNGFLFDLMGNEETANLQPSLWGFLPGSIIYALTILPATSWLGFGLAVIGGIIYLGMMLCLCIRCLRAYRYNVKHHAACVSIRQIDHPYQNWPDELIVKYQAISVADLHQIFSSATVKAKRRP